MSPRRRVALGLAAGGVGLLAVLGACGPEAARSEVSPAVDLGAPTPPPSMNVVLYVVDTLRRDRLGLYGHRSGVSPSLDALAGHSVVFDECSAVSPRTLPSVASMFTSTYPTTHQVLDNGSRLAGGLRCLPQVLRERGYWAAGFVNNPYAGAAVGLDVHYDSFEAKFNSRTIDGFIEEMGDEPFFLCVHTCEPHMPYTPSAPSREAVAEMSKERAVELMLELKAYRRLQRQIRMRNKVAGTEIGDDEDQDAFEALRAKADEIDRLYDACVADADRNVGRLIESLKTHGKWDDTVFLLVSDHGEELFDHDGWGHGQSLHGELIRVPMIWSVPGFRDRPRRVAEACSLLDVLPTLRELLCLPLTPQEERGRSLMPAIRGEAAEARPAVFFDSVRIDRIPREKWEAGDRGNRNVCVRSGRWRAIWMVETDRVELYDVDADPAETRDLAAEHPGPAGELRRFARAWWEAQPPVPEEIAAGTALLDPESEAQLRMLGYIE